MSKSDTSRTPRHHAGHHGMKIGYNRAMRRVARAALKRDDEPPVKMPGFAAKGFCCGNHLGDWRYYGH